MAVPQSVFEPGDPLGLEAQLTPEERAVRDTVRQYCADNLEPHIGQWFEDGELPAARELALDFGKLGLLGMHLPGYGCAGMSAVDYGLACRGWPPASPSAASA
jgi:Acyl-CoA dehydrogenases